MPVSIRTFVGQTPGEQIRQLLAWVGVAEPEIAGIDWDQPYQQRISCVLDVLEKTGLVARDQFYSIADEADQFRSDHGFRALRSVVLAEGMDGQAFVALDDARACAIWVLVQSQTAFDHARAANYADQHSMGRMWNGFVLDVKPDTARLNDPTARAELENRVRELLAKEALAGRSQIEWFTRVVEDPVSGDEKRCVQAIIYQETRPKIEAQMAADGLLGRVTRRPIYEGAIVYEEYSGTIDVVTKGGAAHRKQIAEGAVT